MAEDGSIRRGDVPTLLKLKTMKGADGNPLRIIPRIAAGDYMTLGMCLLQDVNGVDVGLLKKTHAQDGPVGITEAVIQKWLTSGSAPTRTWQHLKECLRQSELGALAEDIAMISDEGWIMQHGSIKVTVNPDVPEHLLSLMEEYADMIVVLKMTKISAEQFTKLTFFLSGYFQSDEICKCSTLSEVIDFLQKGWKIWIFQIDILTPIKKKINTSEVTSCIEQYRQHLNDFLSSTPVMKFKDTLEFEINDPVHSGFEVIILKLDKVRIDDTLQYLKKLVYQIFGIGSKALIHIKTGMGCVCVTWLVPTSLVSTMKSRAEQHSEEYLANLGILELVIGLRVAPNEASTSHSSYRQVIGAMSLEIQTLRSKSEKLDKFKTIKEKSDYEEKCEQQEAELKTVCKEKLDYKEKCERQEAELNTVRKEKSDYEEKCKQQEAELNTVRKEKSDYKEKLEQFERQEVELKAVHKEKSDYQEKCEQLEAELKTVHKEKSDYEEKCEQQEAELKAVRMKKSDYEENLEQFEQQEVELKSVRKEKSDYQEKCEQQEAELKAVRKEKSDYEEKLEQFEVELKAVCKEKSDYEEKCEQQEAELKAVRKEKSDYEKKCEQHKAELKALCKKSDYEEKSERQDLEAKEVEKRNLKKFEELEREKKALVLQEVSKDHIDAIMAGSSATNVELDINTSDSTPTTTHGTKQVISGSSVSYNTAPQNMSSSPITSASMPQTSTTTTVTATILASNPQLASYASYLKGVYIHLSQSHTSQHWTHLPRCEFVQLAMIRDEELRRGGPEEEMVRLAQQGKIEIIMRHKIPTDLESLFLPQPPLVVLPPPEFHRVMLIEGAPGGGKSTLALHICHKWAQGASFLARFDIVVLAYLRDEAIQNASTLADILPADIKKVSQMAATQMKACYGQSVLFIFDGWDEFPPHLQKQSLVSTIIQEPHKLSLHQSTVIITTRPVASGNLFDIADQRVELLGFTRHQIYEYIEKALDGDSTRIQKLVQHLKDHPVIEGYCYIPLHVAILVHIFLIMKGVLPNTLHELFCNLVLSCIVRELETHELIDQNLYAELSSLDDLPDSLKSPLSDISVLAYEGMMRDKVIFYKKDLNALHLPTNLLSLGLLQAVEGLTRTSKSLSYNFLHLSVQELLAAYHLSQMNPSTQVEVFKKLFGRSNFEAVLHYYCGFTKLENPAIQEFISTYSHQQTSFEHILPLLHCFFEAQQPHLAQLVDHKFADVIDLEFLSDNRPVDYIVVGYFIFSLLSTSTSDEPNSIQLKIGDNISDYQFKLLLSELSCCSIGRWIKVDMHNKPSTIPPPFP